MILNEVQEITLKGKTAIQSASIILIGKMFDAWGRQELGSLNWNDVAMIWKVRDKLSYYATEKLDVDHIELFGYKICCDNTFYGHGAKMVEKILLACNVKRVQ